MFRFHIDETMFENAKDMYHYIIESNCGGFTSFNKYITKYDCGTDKHIKYVDRNSMYPTIMTGALPFGDLMETPPEDSYYVA